MEENLKIIKYQTKTVKNLKTTVKKLSNLNALTDHNDTWEKQHEPRQIKKEFTKIFITKTPTKEKPKPKGKNQPPKKIKAIRTL
jgi:hypothetical protein